MAWFAHVKPIARQQKIPDFASFIPLFLEGDTLALYLQSSEEDQLDVQKIVAKLKRRLRRELFLHMKRLGGWGEPVRLLMYTLQIYWDWRIGKIWGNRCAGGYLFRLEMAHDGSLPTIKLVEGKETKALVDTGCTATLIHSDFSNCCRGTSSIKAVDGKEVVCRVTLEIRVRLLRMKAIVTNEIINGFDVIVGMGVISQLRGGFSESFSRIFFSWRSWFVSSEGKFVC